ncbi:MAG: T9SS type A sorting domain-containing protein [Candidatus Oleimicrobiaceae bacterium]
MAIKVDDGRWLIDWARDGLQSTDVRDWVSKSGLNYGDISALPVPGRYGSDRAAAIGVRSEEGRWMADAVTAWQVAGIDWVSAPIYGSSHALPVAMDYDGDGRADLSVVEEDGTWLIDYSANGYSGWDWSARVSIHTSVAEEGVAFSGAPATNYCLRGFPNPSRGPVTIELSLHEPQPVKLQIYNPLGQKVAELAAETRPAGRHRVACQPETLANGTHVCRLVTGKGVHTVKLLLLR